MVVGRSKMPVEREVNGGEARVMVGFVAGPERRVPSHTKFYGKVLTRLCQDISLSASGYGKSFGRPRNRISNDP